MQRRSFLKSLPAAATLAGLATAGTSLAATGSSDNAGAGADKNKKAVLTVAHITDVHITPSDQAPDRFKRCLEEVKQHKPDFFLNGGDSIMAADYKDITRERVNELWSTWEDCIKGISSYDMYSCLGNHDMWWAAPSKEDKMYGKDYVVSQLHIPHRYYSFTRGGWHFVIVDGNNEGVSLDDEQYNWLEKDLGALAENTPVLVMSHYPILGITPELVGGGHKDCKKLKDLFYHHRDKVKVCLSGHQHLADRSLYNGVQYYCNGAVSGFWWGKGDKDSAAPYCYQETPPGYAILKLFADGTLENKYYTPACLLPAQ